MTNRSESDKELVTRALSGSLDAFNELVIRHRLTAVSWARQITKDVYLAEDVVQDALIRSYLYLETLEKKDRFLPWFKNIVMNKAIDHIRKRRGTDTLSYQDGADFLDERDDPEKQYLDQETIQSIRALTASLNERNRSIFEAHFFHHTPPGDLARDYGIPIANVYNILSRARTRLREQIFITEIKRYVEARRQSGNTAKAWLAYPKNHTVYTSLGHTLYEMLQYTSLRSLPIHVVMGISGQAFRIQMAQDAGFSSNSIYNWKHVLEQASAYLGSQASGVGEPNATVTPDLLLRAVRIVHGAIDSGVPAIVWNLVPGEFGLIYGYDDDEGRFFCRDAGGRKREVLYESLGREVGQPEFFVAAVHYSVNSGADWEPAGTARPLASIVAHAYGREPAVPGYTHGLQAYDVWMEAIREGILSPVAHAYHVTVLAEAREHAAAYLRELALREPFRSKASLGALLRSAIDKYEAVDRLYQRLYPSFPYAMPGFKTGINPDAIDTLQRIKSAEAEGIRRLEQIIDGLNDSMIESGAGLRL